MITRLTMLALGALLLTSRALGDCGTTVDDNKRSYERTLQRESAAFNEQYLREYVALIQSRPENPPDADAVQRWSTAQRAFAQKWQDEDPMKTSRQALELMRMCGLDGHDENLRKSIENRFATLVEQRATTLRTAFHRAPKLLEDAMDYYRLRGDHPDLEGELMAVRSQAMQLGDQAKGQRRYTLAAEYYRVAGDDAKAEAVRASQEQQGGSPQSHKDRAEEP